MVEIVILVGIKNTTKSNIIFIFWIVSFYINSASIPEEVKRNKIHARIFLMAIDVWKRIEKIKQNKKQQTRKTELTLL